MTAESRWALPAYSFIIISILVRTIIQVLFKYLAVGEAGSSYTALLTSSAFYGICVLFGILTWSWQQVLSHYPLNFAYPFTSVVFVTLLISGSFFFDEVITLNNVYGSAIIVVGVVLISGDSSARSARA